MIEFTYNNFKKANTSHIFLELNYSYYFQVFFENEYNIYPKSFSANKKAIELRRLINIHYQNLL